MDKLGKPPSGLASGLADMTLGTMPAKLANSDSAARPKARPATETHPLTAALLAWYQRHARVLPWRTGPGDRGLGIRPDPYRVWLSEIMLQQTTVKAVVPYFRTFTERWPRVTDLAAAKDEDVMAAWAGLGYYARARNLLACARDVAALRHAQFPAVVSELAKLPGVGAYTSGAIGAIAFDEPVAAIDGNVERVISRLHAIDLPPREAKREIAAWLRPLIPMKRAGEFAEALMDLGATICTPKKPACAICPWTDSCFARRQGRQTDFPRRDESKLRPVRSGVAYVAQCADGAILLRRRPPRGLLGGMCEVPGGGWSHANGSPITAPFDAAWATIPSPVQHTFTHFELVLEVRHAAFDQGTPPPAGHWWAPADSLPKEALPSVMKKVIEAACPGATRSRRP